MAASFYVSSLYNSIAKILGGVCFGLAVLRRLLEVSGRSQVLPVAMESGSIVAPSRKSRRRPLAVKENDADPSTSEVKESPVVYIGYGSSAACAPSFIDPQLSRDLVTLSLRVENLIVLALVEFAALTVWGRLKVL